MKRVDFSLAALLILFGGQVVHSENLDRERYLVSAKAGLVNLVEGSLFYAGVEKQSLIAGNELRIGEVATVGPSSCAEILLSPGSYLRVNENTQFSLVDASLDNLKLELINGSAVVEASAADKRQGAIVTIATPKADFQVVRGGLYRFNVYASGKTEAMIYKGRLLAEGKEVNDGNEVVVNVGTTTIASFNKRTRDDFDLWSEDRARLLVAANDKIKSEYIAEAYQNSYGTGNTGSYLYGPGYDQYSSWFYDPFLGCYTFLPGAYGFYSPYGWRYRVFHPTPFYWWIRRGAAPVHGSSDNVAGRPGRSVGGTTPSLPPRSHPGKVHIDPARSRPIGAISRSHGGATHGHH